MEAANPPFAFAAPTLALAPISLYRSSRAFAPQRRGRTKVAWSTHGLLRAAISVSGPPLEAVRALPDAIFFCLYDCIAGASLHHPPSGLGATSLRTTPSPWCSLDPKSVAPDPVPHRHRRASPPEPHHHGGPYSSEQLPPQHLKSGSPPRITSLAPPPRLGRIAGSPENAWRRRPGTTTSAPLLRPWALRPGLAGPCCQNGLKAGVG
jgi:hypothetical protein